MTKRSFGVTVLAFSTIMVALYSQYAALSLIVTGSVFAPSGELAAFLTIITGALFAGLTAASSVVGVALWLRKSWAWGWAMGIYLTFFVANAFLSALSGNFGSSILPTIGVAAAVVFLNRPHVRAELRDRTEPTAAASSAPSHIGERLDAPEPAR
jgi:hypothetical protein